MAPLGDAVDLVQHHMCDVTIMAPHEVQALNAELPDLEALGRNECQLNQPSYQGVLDPRAGHSILEGTEGSDPERL